MIITGHIDPTELTMAILDIINKGELIYLNCRSINPTDLIEYFNEKYKKCFDALPLITNDLEELFTKMDINLNDIFDITY